MGLLNRSKRKKAGKELWEFFTPDELKVIGTHILAFQKLSKYQSNSMTGMSRPYPIFDRFMMAVKALSQAHKNRAVNELDVPFKACVYVPTTMKLKSTSDLDEKTTDESKKVFDAIMEFDKSKLAKYAVECGNMINTKYGFTECEISPFEVVAPQAGISQAIEDMAKSAPKSNTDEEEESLGDDGEPKKQRGRPKKVLAEA